MFTGIVTSIGRVAETQDRGDLRVRIACDLDLATVDLGASISCSGVCLTVVDKGTDWFAVDVSGETQSRTPAAAWLEGSRLNLERALRVGDELGGHIVTGHVDGIGEVLSVVPEGASLRVEIAAPADIAHFIAAKGSLALDGVSLTVNTVEGANFTVNIIPHTAAATTLEDVRPGRHLNIEIDILARYLGRMMELRHSAA
ncbi:MAG TPA: riboflavin synthase [Sphingomonadaceae bacterium]|nr:riboflavin synthase [Sphingomonadaceae bacterium]